MKTLLLVLIACVGWLVPHASEAQPAPTAPPPRTTVADTEDTRATRVSPRTYYAKRQRRDQLDRDVNEAQQAYFDANGRLQQFQRLEENEAAARADLKQAQQPPGNPERANSIESYLRSLDSLKRDKARELPALEKQVPDLKRAYEAKLQERDALEQELAAMIDLDGPRQTFKFQMSLAFTGLVGIVIVGFFLIAARDEDVRRQVFSGQAGLQFITLFSLIIAIILFGIVEILEGKELSALLGGLSGYILGRTTTQPTASDPARTPARQVATTSPLVSSAAAATP